MITEKIFKSLLIFFMAASIAGCTKDSCKTIVKVKVKVPVYIKRDDLASTIVVEAATTIYGPGMVAFNDNYIFCNEYLKGVHIVDNTNPSSPKNIGFIRIQGNKQIAVKGNHLYANQYGDLVTLDVSNPLSPSEIGRVNNCFFYQPDFYDSLYIDKNSEDIIIGYKDSEILKEVSCSTDIDSIVLSKVKNDSKKPRTDLKYEGFNTVGTYSAFPGIYIDKTRMKVHNNSIYYLDQSELVAFDISSGAASLTNKITVNDTNQYFRIKNNALLVASTKVITFYKLPELSKGSSIPNYLLDSFEPLMKDDTLIIIGKQPCGGCYTNISGWSIADPLNVSSVYLYGLSCRTDFRFLAISQNNFFSAFGGVYSAQKTLPHKDPSLGTCSYPYIGYFGSFTSGDFLYDMVVTDNKIIGIKSGAIVQYSYTSLSNIVFQSEIPIVKP